MATLLKTLTLELNTQSVECQLSTAELVDEPTTEEVVTFCGTETFASPAYKLNLGGFQDWGDVTGVTEIIHDSYRADPVTPINFTLQVGSATRSGTAKPTQDVPFGGQAGSALAFELTLDVVGTPTEGTVP
jgi:hypothetical protein